MDTALFEFRLPEQCIAQEPLPERDASRLLVLHRDTRTCEDKGIRDLAGLLRRGDLLVLNNTRVIPARLRARRDSSGGKIEFLLLPPGDCGLMISDCGLGSTGPMTRGGQSAIVNPQSAIKTRRVLTKSGGKLKAGETFTLAGGMTATLRERHGEAGDVVEFHCAAGEFERYIREKGEVPLPPYIHRPPGPSSAQDRDRYQTIFAHTPGAVAAPTAGLHFTPRLLEALRAGGVTSAFLTLHVGPGTFRPVKAERVEEHFVDPEPYYIPAETVAAVAAAKKEGRRVIAVGTTSLRALEGAVADQCGTGFNPVGLHGQTDLFVYPPYKFRVVDALLTNFHLPRSSLLMLVCAFAAPGSTEGIGFVKQAYEHAVQSGYRFYSYGDACLFG
ncbi:MAG: tRNA preQ1(34) S-adenosylmethionine ribosyltransferase-isomerase QueA [Planctomycetota bacterium]|nr:tRNA preQ1(34) S-adenosylmethionine ribosyltransferase-isomerase QueA [Planctomycetota bacterium]